ncbi:MAG: GNAT family N-acetyltransferase [Desulfobacteraceae bacterium]|nr:GNAT family N-acetyltransferase [Desulfobacteraceae bacterium]
MATRDVAEKRINDILESKTDHLWVFKADNQIKRWIHLFGANRVASDSFAEIGGLVVRSDCRREGIGRKLVERAMQWAETNHNFSEAGLSINANFEFVFVQPEAKPE